MMNVRPPYIDLPEGFNSMSSNYTYSLPALGGYGVLSITTDVSPKSDQVLGFENAIRGILPETPFDRWVETAHSTQLACFESIFSEETLRQWQ